MIASELFSPGMTCLNNSILKTRFFRSITHTFAAAMFPVPALFCAAILIF